jgi:hypothetical protein
MASRPVAHITRCDISLGPINITCRHDERAGSPLNEPSSPSIVPIERYELCS